MLSLALLWAPLESANIYDGDSFRAQPDAGERALASESELGLEIILGKASGPQCVNLPKREIRRTATAYSYCVHRDQSCMETLPHRPRALRAMPVRDADMGNAHPGWEMATAPAREWSGVRQERREPGEAGHQKTLLLYLSTSWHRSQLEVILLICLLGAGCSFHQNVLPRL